MRIRTASLPLTLGALVLSALTACSGEEGESPGGAGTNAPDAIVVDDASGEPGTSSDPQDAGASTAASTSAPPATVDIHEVDFGNMTWLYSLGGFDLPVEVELIDGTATIDVDGFPTIYTLGEVVYGDVDSDGHDDAVALLSRSQDNGYEALWYVWLAGADDAGAEADSGATAATGMGVEQVKYPIARTGRCGTLVETPVIGDKGIELTEYLRIPGQDDNIPCSDPGTGLKKRTITLYSEGADVWPVQTTPVAAWGGLCAGPKYPDTAPGIVDLWAAPSKSADVAAVADPENGAIFEQQESPLVERDGWSLVGFRVFGVESDLGGTDMACAWALH